MLTGTLYAMPRIHLETLFRTEAKLATMEVPAPSPVPFKTQGKTAVIAIVTDATAELGSIGIVGIVPTGDQNAIEIVSSNALNKRPTGRHNAGRQTDTLLLSFHSFFISSVPQT
ncbi:hypothetical protein [Methylomonas rhizoryzae]|uniref:hypothetical protein n=1 Tax=Methylomonas rhizoryzae TaxID=2608981 RepID=UPI0012326472|nr:hypothetical protein [Methylomonas rhizoryzae]